MVLHGRGGRSAVAHQRSSCRGSDRASNTRSGASNSAVMVSVARGHVVDRARTDDGHASFSMSVAGVEAPAGGSARLDGDRPVAPWGVMRYTCHGGGPRRRGELGGASSLASRSPAGTATERRALGHLGDERRGRRPSGVALDDEVELVGARRRAGRRRCTAGRRCCSRGAWPRGRPRPAAVAMREPVRGAERSGEAVPLAHDHPAGREHDLAVAVARVAGRPRAGSSARGGPWSLGGARPAVARLPSLESATDRCGQLGPDELPDRTARPRPGQVARFDGAVGYSSAIVETESSGPERPPHDVATRAVGQGVERPIDGGGLERIDNHSVVRYQSSTAVTSDGSRRP